MLAKVARFEFRYQLRNPILWATAAATFLIAFASIAVDGMALGDDRNVLRNSPFAILQTYGVISIMFMFVTTAFVANVVIRDDETGFGPLLRSTRISKFDYLIGRFLGAFGIAALCMLIVPLAVWLGTLMPWIDPHVLGPDRVSDHLYGYFLVALPNVLITAAIFFALATITRSMMGTYLGVVGFVMTYAVLVEGFRRKPDLDAILGIVEPFGRRAVASATRYWTPLQLNGMLPDFTGPLLYNRLLWFVISILFLALAYRGYGFADKGISKRQQKKQKLDQLLAAEPPIDGTLPAPLPSPQSGKRVSSALLRMRVLFEIKQVVKSPAFIILMLYGLFVVFAELIADRDPPGRPRYPLTLSLIPKIEGSFALIPLVIAIYYAGELVWRERDRKVHEIVDASAIPNWAYVVPKTAAVALVLFATMLTGVLSAVTIQLSLGYAHLEPGKYLLWYVLPNFWDMLLLAALAVFVQAISPHKIAGWGVMVLFIVAQYNYLGAIHNLFNYGGTPPIPLSDMNGAGSFWIGAWVFRAYWGAFAVVLLVVAHLLWRRGTEIRLKPRLARARRQLSGAPGVVAATALLAFAATGVYAYYNTNILNHYRTQNENDAYAAEYEKKFSKYEGLPQPTVADVKLNIALYPEDRRAVAVGQYVLRNRTKTPITDVHVRLIDRDLLTTTFRDDLELTSVTLAGARLILNDPTFDYRIYRFDRPMQPGEERVLRFETRRWHRGFRNDRPNTRMIENGTFLSNDEFMPRIGMSDAAMLQDRATRRKFGLPEELPKPKTEPAAAATRPPVEWIKADITVSTDPDQTPIAPGKKVSDVTRGGRRIARFVSEAPIVNGFSIQSARYAEKHRQHAGVDLVIYYHPPHAWNIDRMLDALAASLDYYQANFGPYQFHYARILEFPGYRYYFAQAFAGTIPFAESLGFASDYRNPNTLDNVTYTTAHEFAHQYWGHQLVAANAPGGPMLVETLAQYSALMVLKRIHGEDEVRRTLNFELDRYLEQRRTSTYEEPPLARVENQGHVTYNKGALVMYLLQERLGEDAVNRALRSLLNKYKFSAEAFSQDFVDALRAEAKTPEEQALITDLLERITLYDLKVAQPTAVRRADGNWDITVPVEAKKFYSDAKGTDIETPLAERIEVGLFTAQPGRGPFAASNVILMERQPIHSGRQVLKFVSSKKPAYAGIDPYNFYIDRNAADNVAGVTTP